MGILTGRSRIYVRRKEKIPQSPHTQEKQQASTTLSHSTKMVLSSLHPFLTRSQTKKESELFVGVGKPIVDGL